MTIWIDVTDFNKWTGQLTGIQRVSHSLATGYTKEGEDVRFFTYSPEDESFYQSELNPSLLQPRDSFKHTPHSTDRKAILLSLIPSKLISSMPTELKKSLKLTLKGSYNLVLHSKKRIAKILSSNNTSGPRTLAKFKKNDIVIVPGNGWDNTYTARDLGRKKQTIKFKLVYVVYDLIPVLQPHLFGGLMTSQYNEYMFEVLTNADLILPISRSTQRDIEKYCAKYRISQPKSQVIALGNEIQSTEEHQPEWINTTEPFIICVGTIEIRKNHISLYYAYKEIILRGEAPPKLYIVGREGWYTSDLRMLLEQDPYINKLIQIKSNVTDSELTWLYNNCLFSIYPSVYEGWGLPVSESLARGTPTLSSNLSSMPEAGGKFAEYFSPYDTGQMADMIIAHTKGNNSLLEKRKYISKNFKTTSWEESYRKINALIKKHLYN